MKPLKGVFQETNPIDQPDNTLRYGKNGVLNEKLGTVINEPGFTVSSITIPYTPNGGIPIDDKVIVFSTDDTNSAIGLYNEKTDTYTAVLDRTDLGFSLDKPITGRAKKNYRGDIICAFTDKTGNAKYINLSIASNTDDLKDLYLFPSNRNPIITFDSINEATGSVKSGAYYFSVQFSSLDGTITNWSKPSQPIFINAAVIAGGTDPYVGIEAGSPTSKAILIDISNIDIEYDKLSIAVISKINGIIGTPKKLADIDILGVTSKTITYTGGESTTDITLAEILTPVSTYRTVGSFANVGGILYAANLSSAEDIKYQKIANNIRIGYTSRIVKPNELTDTVVGGNVTKFAGQRLNSTPRGYMHDEVGAFYISFLLDGNSRTPAFHIPGRQANVGDKDPSPLGASNGITAKKYQIEDTSTFTGFDGTTQIGRGSMGYWENQNEVYPNTSDFDGRTDYTGVPIVGGEDLRGTPVRHHRFPSIATCKDRFYPTNTEYGRTELDLLGIDVTNVIIPDEIRDKVQGWEIYYARRTNDNSTINGQSLLHLGAHPQVNSAVDDSRVWTTGGNWNVDDNDSSSIGGNDKVFLTQGYLRFYGFDLALNKPQVSPTFISQQLKLVIDSQNTPDPDENWWGYTFDYTGGTISTVANNDKIRRISDFQYVPQNASLPSSKIYNHFTEDYVHAKLESGNSPINIPTFVTDIKSGYADTLHFEETYLINLCSLKSNVYNSFIDQQLVATGGIQLDLSQTSLLDIHGGDTYIGYHSYTTFGPRKPTDEIVEHYNRFVRRFVCESVNNPMFRHESAGDPSSRFFPKTSFATMVSDVVVGDPINRWTYNKDYTSVNDLNSTTPYDTSNTTTNKFPFRIAKCKSSTREEKDSISWKAWLANDYFESVQHRGEIINIEAFGNDRLLIHHKNALYITKTNLKMQTDIAEVVLGSGDIFAINPDEALPSEHGVLGTQHQLSCLMTNYGYFFVDAEVGEIYLYNGASSNGSGIKPLTQGLRTFLRENLKLVTSDNPFTGNGITVAWDEKYDRIILGVKNGANSFTLSYYPSSNGWGMFHDYIPDFLFNTRTKLYSFKTQNNVSNLFIHNEGAKGVYYNAVQPTPTPYPFFIDIVFKGRKDQQGKTITEILQSVNWVSEVVDNNISIWDETIDHITIWNSFQASGKVALTDGVLMANTNLNNRNPNGTWSFNGFRDLVNTRGQAFVNDIFNDYRLINANINNNMSWFNKRRFEDKYFTVRLEYDNLQNKEIILYEVVANERPSFR